MAQSNCKSSYITYYKKTEALKSKVVLCQCINVSWQLGNQTGQENGVSSILWQCYVLVQD